MTASAMWVLWVGAFLASFFVLEFRNLAAKQRGDRDALTLTDMMKTWLRWWPLRLLFGLFLAWLFVHVNGWWGL